MQSLVSPDAQIHSSVEVGPFCHIGPNVKIEAGCKLLSHVVIQGKVSIGKNNSFYPFTTIGLAPQDISYKDEETEVLIGDENIFREGFSLHKGTMKQDGKTIVGSNNYFMAHSHIAHDVVIGNKNTIINNSLIAGHVDIGDGVFVGGATCVQQFIRIGTGSYIGGMSAVEKDIPPYMTAYGNRVELRGLNLIGLKRRGFRKEDIREAMKSLAEVEKTRTNLKTYIESSALNTNNPILKEITVFVQSSKRGIAPFGRI